MKKHVALLLSVCATFSIFSACSQEHTHNYGTEWLKDETHHWHVCKDEDCSKISEKTEHSWENDACTICGQVKENGIRTTITEEEWEYAFNWKNFSIQLASGNFSFDENAFFGEIISGVDNAPHYEALWQFKKNNEIINAGTQTKGGTFTILEPDEIYPPNNQIYIGKSLSDVLGINQQPDFNTISYDEESKAYLITNLINSSISEENYCWACYFENGKIIKIELPITVEDTTYNYVYATISNHGSVQLTPPDYLLQ